MSRTRVLTDRQCKELAAWYSTRMSVSAKARELGISLSALYDGIARGQGKLTSGARFKLSQHELQKLVDEVSRESNQSDSVEVA